MDFENMFEHIGHFGPYQLLILSLIIFLGIFHGYEALAMVFLGYSQKHFCSVEALKELPYDMQKYIAIPKVENSYSSCEVFDLPWSNYSHLNFMSWNRTLMVGSEVKTIGCKQWNYELTLFSRTLQTEFDLVCGKGWYIQMGSTCYLAGMMAGSFISGVLSDRFGRLKVLVMGTTLHPLLGLAIAFCPNVQLFCFLRFVLGVAAFSAFLSGFVYVSELIGPKYRTYACLCFNSSYAVGNMIVALEAYFVRDYSMLMLVMSLPVFITVSYYWILPDSARWLYATGQEEKAMEVINSIAIVNGKTLPENTKLSVKQNEQRGNMYDLFRPELRKTTLIEYFLWISNSLLFYGLALNIGSLVGDFFLNTFVSSCFDVVATMITAFVAEKVGRKPALAACFLIGGITNLAVIPLIILKKLDWLLLTLSLIGRTASYAAFCMTFIITAELFPTQIRQVAMGSCSTCSRISGVVAPYIGGPLSGVWKPLPSLIFGSFGVASAIFSLFLRETLNKPMPDTVEDITKMRMINLSEKKENHAVETMTTDL